MSALINDWENNVAYGKNRNKSRPWLLVRFVSCCTVNSLLVGQEAQPLEHFKIYFIPSFMFGNSISSS